MAGVKQFSTEEALGRCMRMFWTKGYSATSITDLEEATGLSRTSLYSAFGTKEELFIQALSSYSQMCAEKALAKLENDVVEEGVRGMLEFRVEKMTNPDEPAGCLYLLATVEQFGLPDSVKRIVSESMLRNEDALYRYFLKAQQAGLLSAQKDPRQLARFFVAVCNGMAAVSTVHHDARVLSDIVEASLSVLA